MRIVKLYKYLANEEREFVLSKQLLRRGTSEWVMTREAEFAQTKKDFIHKLSIAQKESNETIYWIELLMATDYLEEKEYKSIQNDAVEILKIITSILKTSKAKDRKSVV